MATRDIIPTGYYKKQKFQGPAVIINDNYGIPTEIPAGEIIEVYWASDPAGTTRITTGNYETASYLIVKTKDIRTSVTLQLMSDEFTTAELVEGELNTTVEVPLVVDANGYGFGFYKILTMDEDDMAFRNATWVKYTTGRVYDTVYTNTSDQAIAVSIQAAEYNGANRGGPSALYVDDKKVQEGYELFTIVPAGATYRVVEIGEGVIVSWHELRKAGTT